jgi:hypothetical protein
LKYSLGGHRVDSGWTADAFFKITNFSFFSVFPEKWTQDLKNGFLEAVMSKTELWDFTVKTTVRIESNENKS